MAEPKFYNKDGTLTRYGLSCGYMEREYHYGANGRVSTTLYLEHGVYNVRQYDYDTHERVFWDQFTTLKEARRRFRKAIKHGGE